MSSVLSVNNNYGEFTITGEIDMLTGVNGVSAIRGDNMTAARTGVGTIVVTLKGSGNIKLIELLNRQVNFAGAAPTTALGCRIATVTQTADTDDIVITIKTTATAGGSGADTDGGTAVTLAFSVSFRFMKMGAWT